MRPKSSPLESRVSGSAVTARCRTRHSGGLATATELAAQYDPHGGVKEVKMKLATALGVKEGLLCQENSDRRMYIPVSL